MLSIINTAMIRALTAVSDLRARLSDERGQDLMEYAVITGVIAVVAAGALGALFLVQPGPFDTMASKIAACVTFDSANCQ